MVSSGAIIGMIVQAVISLLIPIVGVIYLRKNYHISFKPVIVGIFIFIVFSQVLEKLIHIYVLMINPTTKGWFDNPWLYATYGGLMAGLFEEGGRFIGFKLFLKKNREYKDGLAYGMGHGGIESILLVTFGAIEYLIFSIMINAGTFTQALGSKSAPDMVQTLKDQLIGSNWFTYVASGIDRIPAVAIHIVLSLIVLYGIRKGKNRFLVFAILLHAAVDFYTALVQKQLLPMWSEDVFLWLVFVLAMVSILKFKDAFQSVEASREPAAPVNGLYP